MIGRLGGEKKVYWTRKEKLDNGSGSTGSSKHRKDGNRIFFLKFKQLFERQGSSKTQKVSSKFKYPVCLKQPKGKTIPAKNQEKLQNYFKNCYRRNTMKCLTVYQ